VPRDASPKDAEVVATRWVLSRERFFFRWDRLPSLPGYIMVDACGADAPTDPGGQTLRKEPRTK
jgi:hypothetical protein